MWPDVEIKVAQIFQKRAQKQLRQFLMNNWQVMFNKIAQGVTKHLDTNICHQ